MKGQKGKLLFLAFFATLAAGCGDAMNANHAGTTGQGGLGGGTPPEIQFDKIESQVNTTEDALVVAEQSLSGIVQNNLLIIPAQQFGLECILGPGDCLSRILDQVFDKLTIPANKAKEVINQARQQIAIALSQLDPNNPAHQPLIAKLMEASKRLDDLEARIGDVYRKLAAKIDVAIQALDRLASRLNPGNPLHLILLFEIEDVKRAIVEFQKKLASV